MSGKYKFTGPSARDNESEDIKWGNNPDTDHLKRLDFGVGFGAGVIFGNMTAGISYNLGLANISSDTSDGMTLKNKVFQISIGYLFGKE